MSDPAAAERVFGARPATQIELSAADLASLNSLTLAVDVSGHVIAITGGGDD